MTALVIPDDLDKRLTALAEKAHIPKDEYALQLLEEILEEEEDYLAAVAEVERMEREGEEAIPLKELIEEYKREHGPDSLDS